MEAGSKCSTEGMAYGNCILNNYTTMNKDMCGKEFAKFKSCVSENYPENNHHLRCHRKP